MDPVSVAATGARRVRSRQYDHTLVLQLDVDEAALWRGVSGRHRSRINGAARRGISVRSSREAADIPAFVTLLRDTENRAGFFSFDDGYFDVLGAELFPCGAATLYFADVGQAPVGAVLVFDFGPTRYYAFATTAREALPLMPAPPLVWQTILDARARGASRYDFWGAAPPDEPGHPWAGITEFKRRFGATPVAFAGTWELSVRPAVARLMGVARAVHGVAAPALRALRGR